MEGELRVTAEALLESWNDTPVRHAITAEDAVGSAFEGMGVEAFGAEVLAWLGTAAHPVLRRPYLSCGFLPMIELLRYLEANGFTTYIASGGDRDFMRPFAHGLR
jgi:hypothetical protein